MATVSNTKEATFTDGSGPSGDILNINTATAGIEVPNNTPIRFYSDAYTTATGKITNGNVYPPQSATAVAIANAGTIATANIGISRLNPASAVTGIIMAAGTVQGQQCWVVNEAAVGNSLTFDVSGTSNIAAGVSEVIPGLSAKLFIWDSGTSYWYGSTKVNSLVQSSTAVAIANAGTVATANINVSRLNPASAVTGIILASGTIIGQQVWVVNEAATANSVTFDVSGTSHVADGINDIIYGGQAKLYIWDSVQSLWFAASPLNNGTIDLTQSATAVATGAAGTIATSGIGVSRVSPATARTGCIMAAGTIPGQLCLVVNEASVANSIQFDVSGTSNVADGINCIIPGLSSKLFVWDSGTSYWYDMGQTINGTINLAQSATAAATANSGTITTNGVGVARVSPAGAVTGVILGTGLFPGQTCLVINEAVVANSVTMAASGTSNVANGVGEIIPGLSAKMYVWDSIQALWYSVSPPLTLGTIDLVQSATAPVIAANGTITTSGVGVARVAPSAARSGIIMQAGTIAGQICLVVNESAFANSIQMDVSGTSNVADGAACYIPGLSSRLFVWNSSTALWYEMYTQKITTSASQAFFVNDGTNDLFNVNTTNGRVEVVNNGKFRIYSDNAYATRSVEISGGTISFLQSTSAAAIANGNTVTTAGVGVARVNPAGNVTGIILGVGTLAGQKVTVINESAFSVTFAASGTSNVADGTGSVIATLTAATFTWNGGTNLWYRG